MFYLIYSEPSYFQKYEKITNGWEYKYQGLNKRIKQVGFGSNERCNFYFY